MYSATMLRPCLRVSREQTGGLAGGRRWLPRPLYHLTAMCSWAPAPVLEQAGQGLSDGGTPWDSRAPQQPCPPGELRARLPCPHPHPGGSVHTAGGGPRLRLPRTLPERPSPPGGFRTGPAQVPGAGVSLASATGEGASAAS